MVEMKQLKAGFTQLFNFAAASKKEQAAVKKQPAEVVQLRWSSAACFWTAACSFLPNAATILISLVAALAYFWTSFSCAVRAVLHVHGDLAVLRWVVVGLVYGHGFGPRADGPKLV